jgi:hypothetical protein
MSHKQPFYHVLVDYKDKTHHLHILTLPLFTEFIKAAAGNDFIIQFTVRISDEPNPKLIFKVKYSIESGIKFFQYFHNCFIYRRGC